jgi:glucokinase
LADVYRFLTVTRRGAESPEMAQRFAAAADPAAVVSATALDGSCERATIALDRWVRVYGAEAGNLALKALAVNGIWIGGGIAPRIASAMCSRSFTDAFCSKGRLTPVLENVPVHLILDDRAALWGAAADALASAPDGSPSPTT